MQLIRYIIEGRLHVAQVTSRIVNLSSSCLPLSGLFSEICFKLPYLRNSLLDMLG